MKASMNGVLNCSILDGWWDEAYRANPEVGWAIGNGEDYTNENLQDDIESKALYDIIEREIIPLFYTRDRAGLPREWIHKMKICMRDIGKSMSSHRMVKDYSNKFYFPALKNYEMMTSDNYAQTKSLAAYFEKLNRAWNSIRIMSINSDAKNIMQRGDYITVTAVVDLGELTPDDVQVELYYGERSQQNFIVHAHRAEFQSLGKAEGTAWRFEVKIECLETGRQGHTLRILPKHEALVHPYRPGFIKWA
jgi:starch phosphorylase